MDDLDAGSGLLAVGTVGMLVVIGSTGLSQHVLDAITCVSALAIIYGGRMWRRGVRGVR